MLQKMYKTAGGGEGLKGLYPTISVITSLTRNNLMLCQTVCLVSLKHSPGIHFYSFDGGGARIPASLLSPAN